MTTRHTKIIPGFDDIINGCEHEPKGEHGRNGEEWLYIVRADDGLSAIYLEVGTSLFPSTTPHREAPPAGLRASRLQLHLAVPYINDEGDVCLPRLQRGGCVVLDQEMCACPEDSARPRVLAEQPALRRPRCARTRDLPGAGERGRRRDGADGQLQARPARAAARSALQRQDHVIPMTVSKKKPSPRTEASRSSGQIALPEGEEAPADASAGNGPGEVTAEALANSITSATGASQDPQGTTGERDASTRGVDSSDGDAAEPGAELKREIIRASGRIEVKLPTGGDSVAAGEAAKHFYQTLYQARTLCAVASNAVTMACLKADEAHLAELRAAKSDLKNIVWPSRLLNLYKIAGDAATAEAARRQWAPLATGILADLSRAAGQKWGQTRWPVLVQLIQAPHWYRADGSLPIRAQSFKVVHVADDLYRLSFSVNAGRHPNGHQFSLDVEAYDGHRREVLKALTSKAWKVGQLRLDQDRRKRSRWYVRFSYTREVHVPTARVVRYAGINRGIATFLAGVIDGGAASGIAGSGGGATTAVPWLYDGARIVAMLKQIQRRRREYQRDARNGTSNRWGHGRARTLLPIRKLEDQGARWRSTTNQTIARAFVKWLLANGVTHLRMEDLSGIRDSTPKGGNARIAERVRHLIEEWPYFDLGARIKSCCEESAIEVEVVPATFITQRCFACGHTTSENVQLEQRKMTCVGCGHSAHLDVNAARNVASGVTLKPDGDAADADRTPARKERKPSRKQKSAS